MTTRNISSRSEELDPAIRRRILDQAKVINAEVMERVATAANDLADGQHRAALGALDGIERQIERLRSFLQLTP